MTSLPGIVVQPRAEKKLSPRYQVVLLNDDDHTYAYVIEMLVVILGLSEERAYEHAQEVDSKGRTPVYLGPLERAEHVRDQIQAYGADPRLARSKGPMSAQIEEI